MMRKKEIVGIYSGQKKKNLAQMAAIMILLDHIKSDLNCLDKTSTSLNSF